MTCILQQQTIMRKRRAMLQEDKLMFNSTQNNSFFENSDFEVEGCSSARETFSAQSKSRGGGITCCVPHCVITHMQTT